MIRINCFFAADEGNQPQALEAAKQLTAASLKDEGNVAYDVFESATRPGVLLICETWKDAESLQKHMHTPHFEQYVGELEKLGQLKIEQFDFPA